ncbi:Uncharacterised protein [Algoriella xinjiangensis]|uniref:hypothetical protein n=1 Tax=Algoriella xinjiangensis TaxID=684065 RepID=UPI000FB743C6|nr:hypothetical protein [Algoriella xinjiangensis]VDH15617.1 Uncharacterised protein [Algoriella xinjiangensis]
MKLFYTLTIFAIANLSYAQIKKATTNDGKVVILNDNGTWNYSDEKDNNLACDLKNDLVKPIPRLRKHVSAETEVDENKIKFINRSGGTNSGNGMFTLCVDGIKMKYRQMGTVYTKLGGSDF